MIKTLAILYLIGLGWSIRATKIDAKVVNGVKGLYRDAVRDAAITWDKTHSDLKALKVVQPELFE